MTHDELVDSACRTYETYVLDVPPRDALRAVVAMVLEEAARIAENKASKLAQHRDVSSALQAATAEDIAEEIRMLKT